MNETSLRCPDIEAASGLQPVSINTTPNPQTIASNQWRWAGGRLRNVGITDFSLWA
jgi:hypothetical protein